MQLLLLDQQNTKRAMMAALDNSTVETIGAADSSRDSHGAPGSNGRAMPQRLLRGPPLARPPALAPRALDIHRVVEKHGSSPQLELDNP